MDKDHDKIVQRIQKRMAGASMLKSQQQKKKQIFQYGGVDSQNQNSSDNNNKSNYNIKFSISSSTAEKSLQQIYNFYVNSYIQPRQHFDTFDTVNQRRLTFQPFILFMKNFKILKLIFNLDKVKLFFKKYANFGKYLTQENFIFLINQMSHHPQARAFFHVQQIHEKSQLDLESLQLLEKQQLYAYMNLNNPQKYRQNFKNVFQPFFCRQKVKSQKIKFTYRKFSQPQLKKKSLPPNKNKTEQKQLYVVKNKEINLQQNQNPFNQAKSIVVSWQSLRSQSLANLQKNSEDIIKKKYLKDDPDNDQFLKQYQTKQEDQKKRLYKKISELNQQQARKNKKILQKIQQKTDLKLSSMLLSKKVK